MNEVVRGGAAWEPPAAREPAVRPGAAHRRRRKLSYELLDCARSGHVLIGTDAATVRPQDDLVAREHSGLRWYRCLRCDAWLPRPAPVSPARPFPPERDEIALPLRGRPLRDRFLLRLIAVDRALHFVVLILLAVAVFVFAASKSALYQDFMRIVSNVQGGMGGPVNTTAGGAEHELTRLFAISIRSLTLTGVALTAYALLEGVEAIGLWRGRRWAEYLTFVAAGLLIPLEIYEITHRPTALKALTLAINVAIVAYLAIAKRLFGIRGGYRAEQAISEATAGWPAVERATPRPGPPRGPR
jgi:uncharacterized membrane protein (DUF2068 family)